MVLKDNTGKVYNILDDRNLLETIEEIIGSEFRQAVEVMISEIEELREEVNSLEVKLSEAEEEIERLEEELERYEENN